MPMTYNNREKSLSEQAADAGIPLRQLCDMLLNKKITSNINFLGADEFNDRLAYIHLHSNNNLNKIYNELESLNIQVESLIPFLKQDLNYIFKSNNKDIISDIDILNKFYPIYPRSIHNNEPPFIKIPSIQVVLEPIDSFFIDLKEIEDLLSNYDNLYCAFGDYDYFQSMYGRLEAINNKNINSCTIITRSEFSELKDTINTIIILLNKYSGISHCKVLFKPTYLQDDVLHYF